MAWFKCPDNLRLDPRVIDLAAALSISVTEACGAVVLLWASCVQTSTRWITPAVALDWSTLKSPGFVDAAVKVGILRSRGGKVAVVGAEELGGVSRRVSQPVTPDVTTGVTPGHNECHTVSRSASERQRDSRKRKRLQKAHSTPYNPESVTPLEEKRADETRRDEREQTDKPNSDVPVTPSVTAAVTPEAAPVTAHVTPDVTTGVTPNAAPVTPAEPQRKLLNLNRPPPPTAAELKSAEIFEQVKVVFHYWREVMDKNALTLMDPKRRACIEKQLRAGRSVDDLKAAVDGCKLSPFHMGLNDQGTKYNDIELICRDASQVEKFINFKASPPKSKVDPATGAPAGYQWKSGQVF